MSKEVKLGLAVGGILLSVMLVYVLVVSGDPATPQGVTLDLPPTPAVVEQPAPPPAVVAEVTPQKPADVAPPDAGPVSQPDAPIAVAEAPRLKNDPWIDLLNKPAPQESTTPIVTTPPANPVREIGPAVLPQPRTDTGPSSPPVVDPSPSNEPRKHVVQARETYSSIAKAAYGDASYFSHIVRANPGIDPAKLRPGMVINLPPESEVRGSAQATRTEQQTRSIDDRSEYRVQGNDSLYKISMKLYGKPDRIDAIYDANKVTIGPDKTKLKVGAVLKLPETPTVALRQ